MGQIKVLNRPCRRIIIGPILPLPEENQLKAEPFTVPIHHITRVIPPLGAEVLMLEVIAGKLVLIAGDGFAPGLSVTHETGGQQDDSQGGL